MIVEIKVPSPGESITEVEIASWLVKNGDFVEKDQDIAEIESDKATLAITAEESGAIEILMDEGETVEVGKVICRIDTEKKGESKGKSHGQGQGQGQEQGSEKEAVKKEAPVEIIEKKIEAVSEEHKHVKITPVAEKLMVENNLSLEDVLNGIKRIGKKEINQIIESPKNQSLVHVEKTNLRSEKRQKMTSLRRKLSNRLVAVKNQTAMLTTFNEVDMTEVMALRNKYKVKFQEKHGVKLGFMSFFSMAVAKALQEFPIVNSFIDEEEIVSPDYVDIAIAVQTPKGLMVPVLRNVESMNIPQIEIEIVNLATKARTGKITVDEMTGGTFTITNGGVFGSMLSTPILNPPQSGILGMHNILERPVAIKGKVEVRPMMYIALSYDHRIIDGKDSVGFLVKVKELLENPHLMPLQTNLDQILFDL